MVVEEVVVVVGRGRIVPLLEKGRTTTVKPSSEGGDSNYRSKAAPRVISAQLHQQWREGGKEARRDEDMGGREERKWWEGKGEKIEREGGREGVGGREKDGDEGDVKRREYKE